MSASLTANGITLDTLPQIVSDILNGTPNSPGYYGIYGSTINVNSSSPDGQQINIFALSKMDMENLCAQVYNSFDPDQALGISLDNVSQYCGISRKGGIYTQVVVTVIVSQNVNLNGLDLVYSSSPFTAQDGQGNQYVLITSIALTAGTYNLNFQSVLLGAIQCLPNTITTPVTIIAGVTSVNNAAVPYQLGSNQETNANLRLRRQASTAFPALGAIDGLYAGLNQLSGVVQANVYENNTAGVVNGIPANGIWVVALGGTAAQIAQVVYNRRTMGCPMKGSQTYNITQANGVVVTMKWDNAVAQSLYIYGYVHSLTGSAVNIAAIQAYIVANWTFGINQVADITSLDLMIRNAQPGVVASGLGVGTTGAYFYNEVSPTSEQNYFTLVSGNINLQVI